MSLSGIRGIVYLKGKDGIMSENKYGNGDVGIESNYAKLCEYWRGRFLELDEQELAAKLPELNWQEEHILLTYYGKEYCISRKDGRIQELNSTGCVSCENQLTIYNLLWYAKEGAHIRNQWVPFRNVRNASPFTSAFTAHVLQPFSETFSGHLENLHHAAQKLGGIVLPQGDAGYQIKAFDCIPVQFFFWDGDDEFRAQSNILFDYSVTDFIHVESTVSIASDGILRLAEEAGLPLKGHIYD